MENQFISKSVSDTIKMIASVHPNVVFCGSLGLVLRGLLKRNVKDIDILTLEDYYSKNQDKFFFDFRSIKNTHSQKFMVGGNEVKCFSLKMNNVKVDVLHNTKTSPTYDIFDFDTVKIRVERPESAINAKKKYVVGDNSQVSVYKHLRDLILLGVDRQEIADIIDEKAKGEIDNYL